MRKPNSLIVGLSVAAGMWLSAIVAFAVGIVLAPVSSLVANFVTLAVFSILVFFVGCAWGKRTLSKNRIALGLAAICWLAPWMGVVSRVHGLSEDLGGVFGAFVVVALVIVVLPASLIFLGLRKAWKGSR